MIAVITGDIINSRSAQARQWLNTLKKLLARYGQQPQDWQIFRGDSFQLEITAANQALVAAYHLKAGIKNNANLDIRMAIGLGEKSYQSKNITEANGSAFVNSGDCFEKLKKKTLAIKTPNCEVDEQMNLLFTVASLTMNNWSPTVASVIQIALENQEKNQKELAKMLKKSQSSISESLKRGGFEEIMRIEKRYRHLIGGI